MEARTAKAFSPGVISNFFAVHDEALFSVPPDYSRAGATGGGFTLSRGVETLARVEVSSSTSLSIEVNGDPRYPARTTRAAVRLLLEAAMSGQFKVRLTQKVAVPIGQGFGSSSASALSAVMAVAHALGLHWSKQRVAGFAHKADIMMRTGLGTVSSTYDHTGAGIVIAPGGPGVAKVRNVRVPNGVRVVTATLSPFAKRRLLSSPEFRMKTGALGKAALETCSDLRFESLLAAGSNFARDLGLTTPEARSLIDLSVAAGALGASQNMLGNAVHAVARDQDAPSLARALMRAAPGARVDHFRIGGEPARILRN